MGHVDHLKSHVVSAILNIRQKVDEDWLLQIFDHEGKPHSLTVHPGDMVWYESASLEHGRVFPLNGSYYENMFVHYMPRSQKWFKDDWDIMNGRPVEEVTLESLQDADRELDSKREELRRQRREEQQAYQALNFQQKIQWDAQAFKQHTGL